MVAGALAFVTVTAAAAGHCPKEMEADRIVALERVEALPKFDRLGFASLAAFLRSGVPLPKSRRLMVALIRVGLDASLPGSGDEALEQLATVFRAVEKQYLEASAAAQVDEGFALYDYANPASTYDEDAHPAVFKTMLKPPARVYRWKHAPEGWEIIPQLDHITVIRSNGALAIYRIDPLVRSALKNPNDALVVAIHNNAAYFHALPTRNDLLIYRRPGADGRGVW